MEFTRHEPCYNWITLALVMDSVRMKGRILIGEELDIRVGLQEARQTSCFATSRGCSTRFSSILNMTRPEIGMRSAR